MVLDALHAEDEDFILHMMVHDLLHKSAQALRGDGDDDDLGTPDGLAEVAGETDILVEDDIFIAARPL